MLSEVSLQLFEMLGLGDEVHVIIGQQNGAAVRDDRFFSPQYRNGAHLHLPSLSLIQLRKRVVNDGRVVLERQPHQHHLASLKGKNIRK